MDLSKIEYVILEAFTGIRRNGVMAFASITTVALSLSVLGAFVLSAMAATNFASAQIGQFGIAVFLRDSTVQKKAEAVVQEIVKLPGVKSATLRSRSKEWTTLKNQTPEIDKSGLPLNPLPFAIDVRVSDPERTTYIAGQIRRMDSVDEVREGRDELPRVLALAHVVRGIGMVGAVLLLIATASIVSSAIRLTLYARRREIRIMQLVGATNEFIRVPLVIEGIFFGASGAVVAWLLLRLGSGYISGAARNIAPMVGQFSSRVDSAQLLLGLLLAGSAIGAAGSYISIRRFLRAQ